jgi:predicted ester cyclase
MSGRLESIYRDYIATLNERRFADLDQFVAADLTYNDEPWTLARYQALLADDVERIPDLHYEIRQLVVDDRHVGSRLWFDCTPQHEVFGIDTAGRRVSFAEHAFYRFRDERIVAVWSVIDVEAIRRQVGPPPADSS